MPDRVSVYLNNLINRWNKKYDTVLVYGAGGVAKDFLHIITEVDAFKDLRKKIFIAVSEGANSVSELCGISVKQIGEFDGKSDNSLVIIATMPVLVKTIEENLKNKGFKNIVEIDEIVCSLYEEIWKEPVSNNKILFSNFAGNGFGGNAKYILLELQKRRADLDFVWLVNDLDTEMPPEVRKVRYGSLDHYRELGTATVWVDNQHKNFLSRKRKGQYYIQSWHGIGPTKKIEFDAADTLSPSYLELCEYNSEMEDLFLSGSGFNTEMCRRGFHYYGEVLECGYPRNDLLVNRIVDQNTIKERLHLPNTCKLVLYAPTFRNEGLDPEQEINIPNICETLERKFGERFICLVRFHPNDPVGRNMTFNQGIINVTLYNDVQELLYISDILIADYSSLMWDFSLQGKPVFLFHTDNEYYQAERGTYISPDQMPYVIAISNNDLCDKIALFDEEIYKEKLSKYFDEYQSFDKGKAACEVADRIIDFIENGTSEPDR